MPLGKDNRSPSQVTGDSGGGVAEAGGEMYFSQSVPPFGEDLLGWRDQQLPDGTFPSLCLPTATCSCRKPARLATIAVTAPP
jgi:hypothetical protein